MIKSSGGATSRLAEPSSTRVDRVISALKKDHLRIASVNVNGVRAAFRKGMGEWLEPRDVDILACRRCAPPPRPRGAARRRVGHPARRGRRRRAAPASPSRPATGRIHRVALGDDDFDSAGRWLEADYEVGAAGKHPVTVVSAYVHSGEAGTPKQGEKYRFLDAMASAAARARQHSELALVVGDLNVGHRTLDIRNWKGNVKTCRVPARGARVLRPLLRRGHRLGGCSRGLAGEVDGPYTWWSQRGQAFDNDTGWRIDYQLATPALAAAAVSAVVDRARLGPRFSDHAPLVVDYGSSLRLPRMTSLPP